MSSTRGPGRPNDKGMMKRSRSSEENIACALRQAEGGTPVADACRQMDVSEATFSVPRKTHAHLHTSKIWAPRQLYEVNAKPKAARVGVIAGQTYSNRGDPKQA